MAEQQRTMNEPEYLDDMIETLYAQIASDIAGSPTDDTDKRMEYLERLAKLRREELNAKLDRSRPKYDIILKSIGIVGSLVCIGGMVSSEHLADVIVSKNAARFIPKF